MEVWCRFPPIGTTVVGLWLHAIPPPDSGTGHSGWHRAAVGPETILYWFPAFAEKVRTFLAEVPDDWDQLMLGGQHYGSARGRTDNARIVRCTNCQRTHAYALRGRFLRDLYQRWMETRSGHCDHVMGPMQRNYRVYAPEPFLCGQGQGKSDIRGSLDPVRFLERHQRLGQSDSADNLAARPGGNPPDLAAVRIPYRVLSGLGNRH